MEEGWYFGFLEEEEEGRRFIFWIFGNISEQKSKFPITTTSIGNLEDETFKVTKIRWHRFVKGSEQIIELPRSFLFCEERFLPRRAENVKLYPN